MQAVETRKLIQLKNILLGTDFSPVSEAAIRYATELARRYGAKLYVAHAVDPTEMTPPLSPPEFFTPGTASACRRSPAFG